MNMNRLLSVVTAVAFLLGGLAISPTFAQGPDATAPSKMSKREAAKMKKQMRTDCAKQAKDQSLKRAERTSFMKDCMAKPAEDHANH
jgi:hypothetical protein